MLSAAGSDSPLIYFPSGGTMPPGARARGEVTRTHPFNWNKVASTTTRAKVEMLSIQKTTKMCLSNFDQNTTSILSPNRWVSELLFVSTIVPLHTIPQPKWQKGAPKRKSSTDLSNKSARNFVSNLCRVVGSGHRNRNHFLRGVRTTLWTWPR